MRGKDKGRGKQTCPRACPGPVVKIGGGVREFAEKVRAMTQGKLGVGVRPAAMKA